MLFGKVYDEVLMMILKVDRSSRNEIVEFIKSIPADLIKQIQKDATQFNPYTQLDHDKDLFGEAFGEDGKCYSYNMTLEELELSVSDERLSTYDNFCLGLNNIFQYGGLEYFDEGFLGHLESDEKEVEYNIYRTPVGYLIDFYIDPERKNKKRFLFGNRKFKDVGLEDIEKFQTRTLKKKQN